ncbi:UNVERIFIED_CONTAM: hypothetical protein Sindi_1003900 [Sesamum indicum]
MAKQTEFGLMVGSRGCTLFSPSYQSHCYLNQPPCGLIRPDAVSWNLELPGGLEDEQLSPSLTFHVTRSCCLAFFQERNLLCAKRAQPVEGRGGQIAGLWGGKHQLRFKGELGFCVGDKSAKQSQVQNVGDVTVCLFMTSN